MTNTKNENDEECFKWAVIAALHRKEIGKDPQRISNIMRYTNNYNWFELEYPVAINKISKQCVWPIFEYGSLSTITTSDTIISEIQWLQNKFIWLALHLSKYISVKLLHDSSGLSYVKDRLLSRATRTSEKISESPLVEESISSNKANPAWDRFPTPLSIIRQVSL